MIWANIMFELSGVVYPGVSHVSERGEDERDSQSGNAHRFYHRAPAARKRMTMMVNILLLRPFDALLAESIVGCQ